MLQENGVERIADMRTLVHSPGKSQKTGGPTRMAKSETTVQMKRKVVWACEGHDFKLGRARSTAESPHGRHTPAGPSRYSATPGVPRD